MFFKSSNEQAVCLTDRMMIQEDDYCKTFTKGKGRDLGAAVFFHKLTQYDRNEE